MPFRYCTQCGFKNVYTLNEAKFCAGCGQSLNQATAGNEPQTTNAPHLQSAQANLEEPTDIPNISKLDYRGDLIEDMEEKSQSLMDGSLKFKQRSTMLKNKMFWANVVNVLAIAFFIFLIIFLLIKLT